MLQQDDAGAAGFELGGHAPGRPEVVVQVGQQGADVAELIGGSTCQGEGQVTGRVLVEDAQGHVLESVSPQSCLPRGDQEPYMGPVGKGGWLAVPPPGADVVEDQEDRLGLAAQRANREGGTLRWR